MAICIVVNGAVGVSAFVVVYGVGGGMHLLAVPTSSTLAFCCLFASFLLYYDILKSI